MLLERYAAKWVKYKSQPFTKRKFVVHKSEFKKMELADLQMFTIWIGAMWVKGYCQIINLTEGDKQIIIILNNTYICIPVFFVFGNLIKTRVYR